jgi:hypothetical protein
MKKLFILAAILLSLALSQAVSAQTDYRTYSNARFGYSISYPADLLTPQGEAENGDGQIFKNADAEMRVYGSNMLLNETLQKEYNALLRKYGKSVGYKVLRANFFVVSGRRNGRIFYRKTMENSDGAFVTFEIEYREAKRAVYDKVTSRAAASLKV